MLLPMVRVLVPKKIEPWPANRNTGRIVSADVQLTIAVECNARFAAFGLFLKGNHTTVGAADSAIGRDVGIGRCGRVDEVQRCALQPRSHAAVDDKGGMVRRGAAEQFDEAAKLPGRARPDRCVGAFFGSGILRKRDIRWVGLISAEAGGHDMATMGIAEELHE